RARYAVEVLAPVSGKPARRLVDDLKRIQDVLGTHQDTVVAREVLRDEAANAHVEGESTFTFGLLHERERQQAGHQLTRLPKAHRKLIRPKSRRWLASWG
ncbi:MAG: CHAD domain-containing protein, partial [Sporichthyaceae bacterium]|nr:CHAD domain-containing protein [Sporichthyaceae bacterium]